MVGGLLLGLGDACWNTQFYSILVSMYNTQSAQAFSIMKFWQVIFALKVEIYFVPDSGAMCLWCLLLRVSSGIAMAVTNFGRDGHCCLRLLFHRRTRSSKDGENRVGQGRRMETTCGQRRQVLADSFFVITKMGKCLLHMSIGGQQCLANSFRLCISKQGDDCRFDVAAMRG